jgi:hypothetical protein
MDQIRELGREERKETLIDLFLDSILDPRYAVIVANCHLRDHITIHECFEAIWKYENIITRENIAENIHLHTRHMNTQPNESNEDNVNQMLGSIPNSTPQKGKIHAGYRTY